MELNNQAIIASLNPSSYTPVQKQSLHNELCTILQHYPSLTVTCQSYAINNSNLNLTQIVGVLPVFIKKVKYNIPIKLIYPQQYPTVAPIFFVTPTQSMILNLNNKNVSPDGKFSLNILNKWKKKPGTLEVFEEAKKEFEKNSPVLSSNNIVHVQAYPPGNGSSANMPIYQSVAEFKQPEPQKSSTSGSGGIIGSAFGILSSAISSVENSIKGTSKSDPKKVVPSNPQPNHFQPSNPVPSGSHSNLPQSYSTVTYPAAATLSVPNNSQPKRHPELYILKNAYILRMKDLKEELLLLHTEGVNLKKNGKELENKFSVFSIEISGMESKKILLGASIKNTEEWIDSALNQHGNDVGEEDLVEYRNEYAKEFIKMSAKEKAIEATASSLLDAMNKGIVSFRESTPVLKSIYSQAFITARLKEKALTLSN